MVHTLDHKQVSPVEGCSCYISCVIHFLDTCDLHWQSTRDSLLITSNFFSLFALIMALMVMIVLCLSGANKKHNISKGNKVDDGGTQRVR